MQRRRQRPRPASLLLHALPAASDLASLFASVAISFWTQRSYKEPLLFGAAACFLGARGSQGAWGAGGWGHSLAGGCPVCPHALLNRHLLLDPGNLLFVLSYQRRSLPVLLLARAANGMGSARAANRRYTADFVGRQQRTMASAGGLLHLAAVLGWGGAA